MTRSYMPLLLIGLGLVGCGTNADGPAAAGDAGVNEVDAGSDAQQMLTPLAAEEQRTGDPEAGYQYLLGGEYTGCGLPERVYSVAAQLGFLPNGDPAPVRESDLPYFLSRFETENGETVVGPNCLTCHAGYVEGELVVGAPGLDFDYGGLAATAERFEGSRDLVADQLQLSVTELAELDKFIERLKAVGPYVQPEVVGIANPADNLAAILFAHRDPETLAWSAEPLLEPPDTFVIPVDTPPWWRMSKKNTMLYNSAGRGDHARIMMAASTLCVDDLEHARRIDDNMGDVRAYIASIQAPVYPHPVDLEARDRGKKVFEGNCAQCHGTYGNPEVYPNLLVSIDEVGTDPLLADSSHFATRFVDWFNTGFYGETARLAPQAGYVAPPLDGIWATAPFLHNGSVPTIAALLDSSKRPTYWRIELGLDQQTLGLPYLDATEDEASSPFVYDTTLPGYANTGHTYGDPLDDTQRTDLIEYLKSL